MDIRKKSLELHQQLKGKIEISVKGKLEDATDLSLMYSPGVSEPCMEIHEDGTKAYEYTMKQNTVAIVTDGTAVLGLGDIGPLAALPVMEGKSALFKSFANVDAIPICLDSKDEDEIIQAVKLIAPGFAGINLEDIKAPKCFRIEEELKKILDIPVFHDDQHGTAIVVLAGLTNALKLVDKKIEDITVTVLGMGAAGMAITKLLQTAGVTKFKLCGRNGILFSGKIDDINRLGDILGKRKDDNYSEGELSDGFVDADVFVGVSAANLVTKEMISKMNKDSIIFALANPVPEIMPEDAIAAGARIVCTGRSDYPNQVNNVLAFPGIFRGALDVRASQINDEMKMAAVHAISELIHYEDLKDDYIIPNPFNKEVVKNVAKHVSEAAIKSGVSKLKQ